MKKYQLIAAALLLSGCIFGSSTPSGGPSDGSDMQTASDSGNDDDASTSTDGGSTPDTGESDMGSSDLGGSDMPDTCGDGALQAWERCDPELPVGSAGACPTSCDDGVACTEDILVGEGTCDATCAVAPITACVSGDGCCPGDCTADLDDDCTDSVVCGDGMVTGNELCDPLAPADGGRCKFTAQGCAPMVCNTVALSGSAQNCDAECVYTAISTCVAGDGCCPMGCTTANDSDCSVMCGDGVIEGTELCDGNCPTMCQQPTDACTSAQLVGSDATCDAECVEDTINACLDDDGCCPPTCDSTTDNDCSSTCGNDVVDAGELCDGDCPISCDDGIACTTDVLSGSQANCNAQCTFNPITQCKHDDGCCAPGCNNNNDNDCAVDCGNGVIEAGEICDGNCPQACSDGSACTMDVLTGTPDTCDVQCSFPAITACVGGDGCCAPGCNANNDSDCQPQCGNGVVEGSETCDGNCPASCNDGNSCTTDTRSGSASQCNVQCTSNPINSCADNDGCCPSGCTQQNDNDCSSVCGNGIIETGESCDGDCPTGPDDCTPCETFVAGSTMCQNQCQPIAGCVLCSSTSCTCGDNEICSGGKCTAVTQPNCNAACEGDKHCQFFEPSTFCSNGSCVQCVVDNDCGPLQFCGPNGNCAPAQNCAQASNPTQYCINNEGPGWACDEPNAVCRKTCSGDSECGPIQECDAGFCKPAQRCSDANNPNAWCVAEGSGNYCSNGECKYTCNNACACPDYNMICAEDNTGAKVCQTVSDSSLCAQICDTYQSQYCINLEGPNYYCGGFQGCVECGAGLEMAPCPF